MTIYFIYTTAAFCVFAGGAYLGLKLGDKSKKIINTSLAHVNGTYRDPAIYEVEIGDKKYRVRSINELQEDDRNIMQKAMGPRYRWMKRFLSGDDAINEDELNVDTLKRKS